MGDKSKIEWTDASWNPIVGCSVLSPGCTNCYAMAQAARIQRMTASSHYSGTTKVVHGKSVWTGSVAPAPLSVLIAPLRWRRPRAIFVNSMGDLFHKAVRDEWIDFVFAVMALAPQHTFIVLTKRSARMREWANAPRCADHVADTAFDLASADACASLFKTFRPAPPVSFRWPLSNVVLGVSAERQVEADARIPDLLNTPADRRIISAEPLLGPLRLGFYLWLVGEDGKPELDGVIVGGESGPGARPMVLGWAKEIVRQCKDAGVSCFVKQLGATPTNREGEAHPGISDRKGAILSEWPEELRVRELPWSIAQREIAR
jgi:protein gp37